MSDLGPCDQSTVLGCWRATVISTLWDDLVGRIRASYFLGKCSNCSATGTKTQEYSSPVFSGTCAQVWTCRTISLPDQHPAYCASSVATRTLTSILHREYYHKLCLSAKFYSHSWKNTIWYLKGNGILLLVLNLPVLTSANGGLKKSGLFICIECCLNKKKLGRKKKARRLAL